MPRLNCISYDFILRDKTNAAFSSILQSNIDLHVFLDCCRYNRLTALSAALWLRKRFLLN